MSNIIDKINAKQINPNVPEFRVGDTLSVGVKITDEKSERVQWFEGIVIARKGSLSTESFTLRKMDGGVAVERSFKVHSPKITIKVIKKGVVRRAKLYFLRNREGGFKIKESSSRNETKKNKKQAA